MHPHVVIPAYNEAIRLPHYLREIAASFHAAGFTGEVLVVDDGSRVEERNAMRAAIEAARLDAPFIRPLLSLPGNRGKGAAVRAGWAAAAPAADWLLFVDADGAISAEETMRLLRTLEKDGDRAEAWFAARVKMRGREVTRDWLRHLSGRVFATMVAHWIDDRVYDSQCGLKAVRVPAWRKIEALLQEDRFAFDVELLAALNATGAGVREFPVDWHDQPGSKVSVFRDGLAMARAVRRIRRRFALGGER